MGWTHDYRDVSHDHRRAGNHAASLADPPERREDVVEGNRLGAPPVGIPRIIGRRARWMTARLRHARSD
ncbi:hypothetical protein AQ490_06625 [Wenjunlia vitaminophila]|uniref:Uncharacterized protein n=1 Tax=Wenjunlia vitaminophila TaxID=76728 RepID=A0A0T6LN91_WENVI|nr:hypothetical protein [Wenjunlia vitaminophila]KRV47563.1 hypothetical protein AQ490_06625 [Wenjunlia vitaminophila]